MTPKLVSLLPSDLARTRGGAERYAFELHAALQAELPGWSMQGLVVASADAGRHLPEGWAAVGGSRAGRRPAGDAIGAGAVLSRLPRDADIVLSHQWRTRATTALRLGMRLRRGARLVGMDHGGGTRLGYALSWMPLPAADVGVHQSEFESRISPIRARRHSVIRGGIDERRFRAASRLPTSDFLMVGRVMPYKGQLRFLECLPKGAKAELIGPADSEAPGYLAAVVEKAAELGVPIRFDVSDEELVRAYQDARYTVQVPVDPRRRYAGAAPPELLGLTMLEAMACGSVPICPASGASAEFVHDALTGLTYEPGSPEALAAVLQAAFDDRERHSDLRQGALQEARRWTWAKAARSLACALGTGLDG